MTLSDLIIFAFISKSYCLASFSFKDFFDVNNV